MTKEGNSGMCGKSGRAPLLDNGFPVRVIVCIWGLLICGHAMATNCGAEKHNLKTYNNPELGIEFCLPSGLVVQTEGHNIYVLDSRAAPRRNGTHGENRSELLMNGKRMHEPYDYLLQIKVRQGNFFTANHREGIFDCKYDLCRSNIGRFKPTTAEPVNGRGWKGYKVEIICSREDAKTGFHAAGGVCFWALGSDSQRYFVLDTSGDEANVRLGRSVIKSLRLAKDSPKD